MVEGGKLCSSFLFYIQTFSFQQIRFSVFLNIFSELFSRCFQSLITSGDKKCLYRVFLLSFANYYFMYLFHWQNESFQTHFIYIYFYKIKMFWQTYISCNHSCVHYGFVYKKKYQIYHFNLSTFPLSHFQTTIDYYYMVILSFFNIATHDKNLYMFSLYDISFNNGVFHFYSLFANGTILSFV